MLGFARFFVAALLILFSAICAHANERESKWLSLDANSKDIIRKIIKNEVQSREGFSSVEEDKYNTLMVEAERQKESSAYKAAIDAAKSEFQRSKRRLDVLEVQFQTASYDVDEMKKNVLNIKTSIKNIDNQIVRYQTDRLTQQESLRKWLKTKKQGEVVVAVIYTRGFRDTAHELEGQADVASAPLMAQYMGTQIRSNTNVIESVLANDFIHSSAKGTAKWNREEPLRIRLKKGHQGTTYLRVKRYELYPFQEPKSGKIKPTDTGNAKASIITSMDDLKSFMSGNNFSSDQYDLSQIKSLINDTELVNRQAEEDQREQLLSFNDRIKYLDQKITNVRKDKKLYLQNLKNKHLQMDPMKTELDMLRLKKESALMAFQDAQRILQEKMRIHESIIIKTSLVTVKRSETPAEASAEAVIEELKDVLNDARIQHSTSTADVINGKLVSEKEIKNVTNAKIIAVCPISFINEGDSIRVKMAFRVRTILDGKESAETIEQQNTSVEKGNSHDIFKQNDAREVSGKKETFNHGLDKDLRKTKKKDVDDHLNQNSNGSKKNVHTIPMPIPSF